VSLIDDDRLGQLLRRIKEAAAVKSVYVDTNGLEKLQHFVQGLTRKIPTSVRLLLQEITPTVWQAGFKNESVRLLEFSELEWIAPSELDKYGIVDRSGGAEYFAFACGIFGDGICVRCTGSVEREVLLADHEGGGFIYLAHDLCEWIERLIEFDGVDYAYTPGGIENLESGQQRAILEFHRELNPHLEWVARGLTRLDFPNGHPKGYLHWNGHDLMPLAEAGHVEIISLSECFQKDLESIAAVGLCRDLTISRPRFHSFDSLSRLEFLVVVAPLPNFSKT
jgi:hypothetical protein